MEAISSLIEETAMELGVAPSRSKSKTALNRRPSGYWKVFSNWWRGRYAALKTRPTVNEVIEWYHRNAASSWPNGQVPCLKAVLRQSKGLRPIDGLKEYFREYRKKRKQQGGLALKAGDDVCQRRSRPIKRRRGRAANKDSSDEEDVEELDQEASAFSDQRSSDGEEDVEDEDTTPQRRQRGCAAAMRDAAVEAEAGAAADSMALAANADGGAGDGACRGLGSVQAVFEAWQHFVPGGSGAAGAGPASLEDSVPPHEAAAVVTADLACITAVGMDVPDAQIMSLPHALAAASGDAVHPAVAYSMVPIASGGSPRPPYALVIRAVAAVRRPPSRPAASRRSAAAPVSLPPLSSAVVPRATRAVAAAAPGDAAVKLSPDAVESGPDAKHDSGAQQDDDHAGDRCSTGGGAPGPCDARFARPPYMHERVFDGYGYEYTYGPPPPYACHQSHPCCYRPSPYPVAYPYRAVSSAPYPPQPDCSTGGGATSSFSPAAPWPAMVTATDGGAAFPQHQSSTGSPLQMGACYSHPHHHPHPHHPSTWAPWGPADGAALWQGGPPPPHYPHDAAWARGIGPCSYLPGGAPPMGCPCSACPETARFHSSSAGPCQQHPQGMRPLHPHACFTGYGPRHGGMPTFPVHPTDMWAVPAGREPHPLSEGPLEGEACSSSISEHDDQEAGRRSPCSGTSGRGSVQPAKPCTSPTAPGQQHPQQPHWLCHPAQQFPMMPSLGPHLHHPSGCYPVAMYHSARGMATTGSVTSMASMAAVHEEPPFMVAAGACRAAGSGFAGVARRSILAVEAAAAAAPTQAVVDACDPDVLPYLADAPVARCASDAAEKGAEASLLPGVSGAEPEAPECGLGLADGFGLVAREAMDHDLAFAFENFMACDAAFDALACQ